MKVLVTGAAGRVGANLVTRLVGAGADVTALVLPGDAQAVKLASLSAVRVVEGDLREQASLDRACAGVTHVAHLAAQLVRGDTPVDEFYDTNAFGTLRLLEAARRHGGGLERFVLVSTDGTYRPGDPPSIPLREDDPQHPADYYGTSKLLGEVILRNHAAQFDIPFSIVRFATALSPDEAARQFRVGTWRELLSRGSMGRDTNIWHLFEGRPNLLEIFDAAAGEARDDAAAALVGPEGPWTLHMLDVRDAAQGVHLALVEPRAEGRAFNIAGPEPTAADDGAAIVADAFGVPRLTVEMPMTFRLELSIDAARSALGYEPRYDFAAMVASAASEPPAGEAFIPARI